MAAWALGEIKDRRAVKPLIDALGDQIKDVRKKAALALKEITGKDFGKDPAKWQEWWEKNK
jgi:HEAT repeat protein